MCPTWCLLWCHFLTLSGDWGEVKLPDGPKEGCQRSVGLDPSGDVEDLGHLRESQPHVDMGAREDALSRRPVLVSSYCVLFALVFADVTAYSWTRNVQELFSRRNARIKFILCTAYAHLWLYP